MDFGGYVDMSVYRYIGILICRYIDIQWIQDSGVYVDMSIYRYIDIGVYVDMSVYRYIDMSIFWNCPGQFGDCQAAEDEAVLGQGWGFQCK